MIIKFLTTMLTCMITTRGGGLLKYCNLLVKNYRPAWPEAVKTMERYMCSRYIVFLRIIVASSS